LADSIEEDIPKLSNDDLLHKVINAIVIDNLLPEGTRILLDIKRRRELSKRLRKIGFIKRKIEE
jgi:hypothetical protein